MTPARQHPVIGIDPHRIGCAAADLAGRRGSGIRRACLRWLVLLVLVNALTPGIAESAAVAAPGAAASEIAYSAPRETDPREQGPEHSCGVVFHQCDCCASMTFLPHDHADVGAPVPLVKDCGLASAALGLSRSLEPPFRPPIR